MDFLRMIAGGLGTLRIDGTSLIGSTQRPFGFYSIKVVSDTAVIGVLTEMGVDNSLTEHGLTGKTLAKDEFIVAKTKFTSIQLTSGVVSIA